MEKLVKIDTQKLNSSQLKVFSNLFNTKARRKLILKQTEKTVIVKPALFDFLEYEFLGNSTFRNKLRFSLIGKNNNKFKILIEPCKMSTDNYNAILREIRF